MDIKNYESFRNLGFQFNPNRLCLSNKGYYLVDFRRQGNAKCKICNQEIPGFIYRWSYGTSSNHFCPDCLDQVNQLIINNDITKFKELGFKKITSNYIKEHSFVTKDPRKSCIICKKRNLKKEIYFGVEHKYNWWAKHWKNVGFCPDCMQLMVNQSHLENYEDLKLKWMLERVAKRI